MVKEGEVLIECLMPKKTQDHQDDVDG